MPAPKNNKCSSCGARFNPTLVSWNLFNRDESLPIGEIDLNAYWLHDCNGPQESMKDFLYRTDLKFRQLVDKANKNAGFVK